MATKPVKHILSTMAGAPVLNGVAGSLIAVLDTLVNGCNNITLDSLVVAGNVLTGTKASHGFIVDQVVATTANEAALTGEWTVTSVTSGTFTASAPGVADVTGTGTLSAKTPGAGWLKVFSGTNKAVYKSSDPTATGMYLRVDDTGTTSARVVGYESMTDVDTGVGPYPTAAQISGGGYFLKSDTANSTAKPWMLFADSKGFLISVNLYSMYQHQFAFSDFTSTKQGDAYCNFLACSNTAAYSVSWGSGPFSSAFFTTSFDAVIYAPRSYTQLGSSIALTPGFCSPVGNGYSGVTGGLVYPSGPGNGLLVTDIILKENSTPNYRALNTPGVFATPQVLPLTHGDKVSNITGLTGRKLMALAVGANNAEGRIFIDITGPWR